MNDKMMKSILDNMARIRAIEDRIVAESGCKLTDITKAIAEYAIAHEMSAVAGSDGHGNRYTWTVVKGGETHIEPDGKAAIKALEQAGLPVPTHEVKGRAASLRKG